MAKHRLDVLPNDCPCGRHANIIACNLESIDYERRMFSVLK